MNIMYTFIFQKLYHDIKIEHVLHKKSIFTNNRQGFDILLPTILNLKNIYNSSSIKKLVYHRRGTAGKNVT